MIDSKSYFDGIDGVDERRLQRAVQVVFSEPGRVWTCTNADAIQIVASGMINPFDGPDFRDMAVLHKGTLFVGAAEFHRKASDWFRHGHAYDEQYASVLLHVVLAGDCVVPQARWTLVLTLEDIGRGLAALRTYDATTEVATDELQHHALLRLLRTTAEADIFVRRQGPVESCISLAGQWVERLSRKRHRPIEGVTWQVFRRRFPESGLGRLVAGLSGVTPTHLLEALDAAEVDRIGVEGTGLRRELLVNAVLPVLCAIASDNQRVVLLQWYWTARSVHRYGSLGRRYPGVPQLFIWQQQGLLEYQRHHGARVATCADVVRQYGLGSTLRFLEMASGP